MKPLAILLALAVAGCTTGQRQATGIALRAGIQSASILTYQVNVLPPSISGGIGVIILRAPVAPIVTGSYSTR
jgi:hypothetical protein